MRALALLLLAALAHSTSASINCYSQGCEDATCGELTQCTTNHRCISWKIAAMPDAAFTAAPTVPANAIVTALTTLKDAYKNKVYKAHGCVPESNTIKACLFDFDVSDAANLNKCSAVTSKSTATAVLAAHPQIDNSGTITTVGATIHVYTCDTDLCNRSFCTTCISAACPAAGCSTTELAKTCLGLACYAAKITDQGYAKTTTNEIMAEATKDLLASKDKSFYGCFVENKMATLDSKYMIDLSSNAKDKCFDTMGKYMKELTVGGVKGQFMSEKNSIGATWCDTASCNAKDKNIGCGTAPPAEVECNQGICKRGEACKFTVCKGVACYAGQIGHIGKLKFSNVLLAKAAEKVMDDVFGSKFFGCVPRAAEKKIMIKGVEVNVGNPAFNNKCVATSAPYKGTVKEGTLSGTIETKDTSVGVQTCTTAKCNKETLGGCGYKASNQPTKQMTKAPTKAPTTTKSGAASLAFGAATLLAAIAV